MKKTYLLATILVGFSILGYAQNPADFFEKVSYRGAFGVGSSADWTKPWANFAPNQTAYPGDASYTGPAKTPVVVNSDISANTTWSNANVYYLEGPVHVLGGATLTIEKGTVIRGKNTGSLIGALIVAKGGKLVAEGTALEPIVFTSEREVGNRSRGDWAGIMLCGKATINAPLTNSNQSGRPFEALTNDRLADYGSSTPDDNDNSGTLKYVRIEYAGYAYAINQELNSLTLAAVGRGTTIDYVQCSFGQDDSFEWFGGTVNAKHLVALAGTDDDFDMDEGYKGFGQFFLGVRHPGIYETASNGQSNGFEHDNNTNLGSSTPAVNPGVNNPLPVTSPTLSNVTLVGPLLSGTTASTANALNAEAAARFNNAMELRTSVATNLFNSVAFGYPKSLILNNRANLSPSTATKAASDSLVVRNTTLANATGSYISANSLPTGFTFSASTWLSNGPSSGWGATAGATLNKTTTVSDSIGLVKPAFELASGIPDVASANVNQISFANSDFTLKSDAPLLSRQGACFAHPRLGSLDLVNCAVLTSYENELEVSIVEAIVVYPNPATDKVQVYTSQNFANTVVSIQNAMGTTLATQAANDQTVTFETSNFSNGMYIVTVNNGGKITSKTLLINR
jgi:hypothetical protein